VRVNQDCGFRLQSEEGITSNPVNPSNLLGGMNDEAPGPQPVRDRILPGQRRALG